ncbi:MAG: AMP-binding protein [Nocardioidaceae bacterium]
MDSAPTFRPVAGAPDEVERLVAGWLAADDPPALTVRTSGSSGVPKDVALSRRAVTASAAATLERLGGPGQWVLALRPQYVAGLQVVVRSVLAGTSPVVLTERGGVAAATAALTHSRRYLALVPIQLHRMLASPTDTRALTGFDAVLVGGGAVRPELLERARRQAVEVVTTYGMSETCGGCVYDGVPLDGVSLQVDDAGRILLSGPVLFDRYVDQPALTAQVLRDGWLHTPDLGRLDADGRLEVLGRVDDMAVSGGVNVPLAAVHARLLDHPAVNQAAVVGVPDAEWGARVVAVLVPEAGVEQPRLDELRDFVSAVHPRTWAPRQVVFTDVLPALESGKVDRLLLQRELARLRV